MHDEFVLGVLMLSSFELFTYESVCIQLYRIDTVNYDYVHLEMCDPFSFRITLFFGCSHFFAIPLLSVV